MALISLQSLSNHPQFTSSVIPGPLLPEVAHEIGLRAFGSIKSQETISDLAREYDVSRPTIYALGNEVGASWEHFVNYGGRRGPAYCVPIDRRQIVRSTIGARCGTNASLRNIQVLHETFYSLRVSFGFVQGVVRKAEEGAAVALDRVDISGIEWVALDELFIGKKPILVGVDLKTSYIFCMRATEDRKGETWKEHLLERTGQGLSPVGMVGDEGKGLGSGALLAWPEIKKRVDMFHVKRRISKTKYHLERRGYGAIEAADKAEKRRLKPKKGDSNQGLGQKARRADEYADLAMLHHDAVLECERMVNEELEFCELNTGSFRDSNEAASRIVEAAEKLMLVDNIRCKKLGKYLKNLAEAVCAYIDDLVLSFDYLGDSSTEQEALRLYAWLWRLGREQSFRHNRFRRAQLQALVDRAIHELQELNLGEARLSELLNMALEAIDNRNRASSLVEAVNSVLRPLLEVHKHVTQGALDLFAAWWNFRPRTLGKLKGSCPYTKLTGRRVNDWLSMIGCPSSGNWN